MSRNESRIRVNSFLLALYIMQYTLILPFTKVLNSTLLTAGTSLLILLLFVIINGRIRLNLYYILVLAGIIFALLMKILLFPSSDVWIFVIFAYTAFPAAFAAAYDYDAGIMMSDLYRISIAAFFLTFWYPFIGTASYMRFGYAVLPCVLFIVCDLMYNKTRSSFIKIVNGGMSFILLVEMFFFGSRGAFLSFLLFFGIEEILINRKYIGRKLLLVLAGVIAFLNIGRILDLLAYLLGLFDIHSYALIKYRMMFRRGFDAASSGRDVLYDTALTELRNSPILGVPISSVSDEGKLSYVHNLFLQTWMDLGIIGLIVLVIFLLSVIWKIGKKGIPLSDRILITALFAIAVGRLMFSSVIWRRPEFWLLVFMSMKMDIHQSRAAEEKLEGAI